MGIVKRYDKLGHHFFYGETLVKENEIESELNKDSQGISFQCMDAIEISLFIEKEGLGFYEKAAKNVSDRRVTDIFLRLEEEEREHIQILNPLKPWLTEK